MQFYNKQPWTQRSAHTDDDDDDDDMCVCVCVCVCGSCQCRSRLSGVSAACHH